jgi:[methyl-Co(III) methanol-specific corrinoid protein]:coenzyme M methyltransferase
MSQISQKERLLRVLDHKTVDRPPVICTGGMMNAAIVEVMSATGNTLPEAHHEGGLMAALSTDVHQLTGFENLGIPFCMTVEAELLGSEIDFGTLACEPKIAREIFPNSASVEYRPIELMLKSGRIAEIVQAGYRLSQQHPDSPVIGNLTGPISTAASIVDPVTFLKELRKDRENAHKVLNYVSDLLIAFGRELIANGATLISIGDPTATGEILGPKVFAEFAVPYLNKVIDGIHAAGAPVIVHICGKIQSVKTSLPEIRANAISTDALVNLRVLKEEFPQLTTMGNVSTFMLELTEADKVARHTAQLVRDGIDIIAPACGLSTSTTLTAIRAMTETVKSGDA